MSTRTAGLVRAICHLTGLHQSDEQVGHSNIIRGIINAAAVFAVVLAIFTSWRADSAAAKGINNQINYQGKLLTSVNVPVGNGTFNMKFSLYDAETGGNRLWSASGTLASPQNITVTTTNGGLFSILLGGGGQNSLTTVDWNQTSLWLGVTVGSDSEMTPRKRLGAAPQAFNSERWDGRLTASSVASGEEVLKLSQTNADAATADRVTLILTASGTSNVYDLLLKGQNATSDVFTISRQGHTTTTGNLGVSGQTILGTSSANTLVVNSSIASNLVPDANATRDLGSAGVAWRNIHASSTARLGGLISTGHVVPNSNNTFDLGATTSSWANIYASGTLWSFAVTTTAVTSTNIYIGLGAAATPSFSFAGDPDTGLYQVSANRIGIVTGGALRMTLDSSNGEIMYDKVVPSADLTQDLGTASLRWRTSYVGNSSSTNLTFSEASGTNLYVTNNLYASGTAWLVNVTSTNVTTTHLQVQTLAQLPAQTTVGSQNVCLVNGVNCPSGAVTDDWAYDLSNDFLRPNTSTSDLVIGGVDRVTSPLWFRTDSTSTRFYFGAFGSSTNIVLGGTTSTLSNTAFQLDGNDLYAAGNLGSASSVYTNGAFIAGTSTQYGEGLITRTGGDITVSSTQANLILNPSLNGYIGMGTSTPSEKLTVVGNIQNTYVAGQKLSVASTYNPTISPSETLIYLAVQGKYAYVVRDASSTLTVVDVSDPGFASSVGSVSLGSNVSPTQVAVSGRYAYTINFTDNLLSVVDVSNPAVPAVVGTVNAGSSPWGIAVQGHYAYVTLTGSAALAVIDISDPTKPRRTGSVSVGTTPYSVAVSGRYAYVASGGANTMSVVDISNPTNPVQLSTVTVEADPRHVAVQGRYAYVSNFASSSLSIVDISRPNTPVQVATTTVGASVLGIAVSGRYAYLSGYGNSTMIAIDVSSSTNPIKVATVSVGSSPYGIAVQGRYAYTANRYGPTVSIISLGGMETSALTAAAVEGGSLLVRSDGTIGNNLSVVGGVSVGAGGLISAGGLSVASTNTTSSIMGNLTVGTSTMSIAMNSQFTLSGDDLFVQGNIGAATSVYTNGAFIVGTGSTYYGNGFITKTDGDLVLGAVKVTPKTNNTMDLGSATNSWANIYASGTAILVTVSSTQQTTDATSSAWYFAAGDGAQSRPSFTFTADTDTGWYRAGANAINITTGADSAMQWNTSLIRSYRDVIGNANNTYSLGSFDNAWRNIYASSTAFMMSGIFSGRVEPGQNNVFDLGTATNSWANIYASGTASLFAVTTTAVTSTNVYIGLGAAATPSFSFAGDPDTGLYQVSANRIGIVTGGALRMTLDSSNGEIMYDKVVPSADLTQDLGTASLNWRKSFVGNASSTNLTFSEASGTNIYLTNSIYASGTAWLVNVTSTNATTTHLQVQTLAQLPAQTTVGSQNVCLVNGVNCPAGAVTDDWAYDLSNDFLRPNTSTSDLVIGGIDRVTSPLWFRTDSTSTRFYFGAFGSSTNIVLGGTTSTLSNTAFQLDGNDFYTAGNIGSASSVYTNGAFIAGTSTQYGEGLITRTGGDITVSSTQANLILNPSLNGYIGMGTSTPSEKLTVVGNIQNTYVAGQKLSVVATYSGFSISTSLRTLAVAGRYMYVPVYASNTLMIIDISDPASPTSVGMVAIGTNPHGIAVAGKYAYTADSGNTMSVVDISNPSTPALVGSVSIAGIPQDIAVSGHYAYVLRKTSNAISVVDVSDPTKPLVVGSVSVGTTPQYMALSGRYLYVANYGSDSMSIVDVINPTAPVQLATVTVEKNPWGVAVSGRYAYVTNFSSSTLSIVDISNPTAPVQVATTTVGSGPISVAVSGRYAYVVNFSATTISILDVASSTRSVLIGATSVGSGPYDIAIAGRYIFIPNANSATVSILSLGGMETSSLAAASLESGTLSVRSDGTIGNNLSVVGGVSVGAGGLISAGGLSVASTNTTSSIMGNLTVGTSTMSIAMNSQFTLSGDDLFVQGNIGAATSVYTNGAFIVGPGSTYYGNGFITKTDGDLVLGAVKVTPKTNNTMDLGSATSAWANIYVSSTSYVSTTLAVAGSVGQPSYSYNGDRDTGIWNNTDGDQDFVSNGALVFRMNSTSILSNKNLNMNAFNITSAGNISPYSNNTYDLGTAALSWRNIYASGTASLGGLISTGHVVPNSNNTFDLGATTSSWANIYASGTAFLFSVSSTSVTSTNVYVGLGAAGTPSFSFAGDSDTGLYQVSADRIGFTTGGVVRLTMDTSNALAYINFSPSSDLGSNLGQATLRWAKSFVGNASSTNLTFSEASGTNIHLTDSVYASGTAWLVNVTSTNVTTTHLQVQTLAQLPAQTTVGSQNVCLVNGVNCPSGAVTDDWAYDLSNDFLRPNTSTSDLVIGGVDRVTSPLWFRTDSTSTRFYFGAFGSSTNIVLGGTTSTLSNTAFQLDGNDLYAAGNLGSASSVYTNGAFIAGTSTWYGEGYITRTGGDITVSSTQANLILNPSLNGYIGMGTSTPSEKLTVVGNIQNTYVAGQKLSVAGTVSDVATSTETLIYLAVQGKYAYVVRDLSGLLTIEDVSDPAFASSVSSVYVGAITRGVTVSGRYAYVANGSGSMVVVDVSNPAVPAVVGTVTIAGTPWSIAVSGHYAYVGRQSGNAISVIDISDPTKPRVVGTASVGATPLGLAVSGRYAYVSNNADNTVSVVDISNPTNPVQLSTVTVEKAPRGLAVSGRYVYVTNYSSSSISIIDVSHPNSPVQVATTTVGTNPLEIVASGRYVYVTEYGGASLSVIDVSSSTLPIRVATVGTGANPYGLALQGRYVYTANRGGLTVSIISLGGLETSALAAASIEGGSLLVRSDGTIGNNLSVAGGVSIGAGGLISAGGLSVASTNTTSSIMGNLTVGTSTMSIAMNSQFTLSGDDLFVQGNIGAATSVYTNGAFIVGTGSTYYGNGFITKTDGDLVLGAAKVTPNANNTMDLGSATNSWANIYASGTASLVYVTSTSVSTTNLSVNSSLFYANGGLGRVGIGTKAPNVILGVAGLLSVGDTLGATQGQEIRFTGASGNMYTVMGTEYSGATSFMSYNAYQTNAGTAAAGSDSWTQNNTSLKSAIIKIDPINGTAFDVYSVDAGKSAAAKATFWGTPVFTINSSGTVRVIAQSASFTPDLQQWQNASRFPLLTVQSAGHLVPWYNNAIDIGTAASSVRNINASSTARLGGLISTGHVVPNSNNTFDLGATTSSWANIYASGTAWLAGVTSTNVTSSRYFANLGVVAVPSYTFSGDQDTGIYSPSDGSIDFSANGALAFRISASTILANKNLNMNGFNINTVGNISPYLDDTYTLGTATLRWSKSFVVAASSTNLTFSEASGTNLYLTNSIYASGTAWLVNVTSTNVTSSALWVQDLAQLPAGTTIAGRQVCLQNGTNCPAGVTPYTSDKWAYNGGFDFIRPNTNTTSMVLGGTLPTEGPLWFRVDTTSTRFYFGAFGSSTNIVLGGTTSTISNTAFQLDGNDFYTAGNLGSASSVYSNGVFIANSTYYGPQYISETVAGNNLTIQSRSNVLIQPNATEGAIALNVGMGTSTPTEKLTVVGNIQNTVVVNQGFTTTTEISAPPLELQPEDVFVQGRYAYITAGSTSGVLQIIDVSNPSYPQSVTSVRVGPSGQALNSVFVAGKYAYVVDITNNKLAVIDVSSPASSSLLSTVNTDAAPSDVYIAGRYAYIAANGAGTLQIMDVNDPNSVKSVSSLAFGGTSRPTNLAVQGRFAYITLNNVKKMAIVDVSDPYAPTLVTSTYAGTGPQGVFAQGRYVYVVSYNDSVLRVIDVSSPQTPRVAAAVSTVANPLSIAVSGRYAYIGNLAGQLQVWDVASSTNPVSMGTVTVTTAVDSLKSLFVAGRYLYLTDYDGSRLSIFDVHGIETNGLIAATAELGSLQVRTTGYVENDFTVGGGLMVGQGGIYSEGGLGVYTSTTNATSTVLWNSATNTRPVLFIHGGCTSGDARTLQIGNSTDDAIFSFDCRGAAYADVTWTTPATDFAEYIRGDGSLVASDVLVLDTAVTSSARVKRSSSLARNATLGVYSTKPAFAGGAADGGGQTSGTVPVALLGQVPTKVSAASSSIAAGDTLMVGDDGYAVKAKGPGMTLGTALQDLSSGTGTIMVFVRPMWWAGDLFIATSTGNLLAADIVSVSTTVANVTSTAVDSPLFTFQGSAWDAASSTLAISSFSLMNDVVNATTSRFSLFSNATSSPVLTVSQTGDLAVSGRLYPSDRGAMQFNRYIFYDGSSGPGGDMMRTNAAGWGTGSYDFAEMFPSSEQLLPGDIVVVDPTAPERVKKSSVAYEGRLVGIVSTRPGFLAGNNDAGAYPVALAGRVPTKVSTANGAIKAGDSLAASSQPGVAMKASSQGPSIGLALQDYDPADGGTGGASVTSIIAFVNVTWYAPAGSSPVVGGTGGSSGGTASAPRSGMAMIKAGDMQVDVTFESLNSYPLVLATPYGIPAGGFGIHNVSDKSFSIVLLQAQSFDLRFSWTAQPSPSPSVMQLSDGTSAPYNGMTGELQSGTGISPSGVSAGATSGLASSTSASSGTSYTTSTPAPPPAGPASPPPNSVSSSSGSMPAGP